MMKTEKKIVVKIASQGPEVSTLLTNIYSYLFTLRLSFMYIIVGKC